MVAIIGLIAVSCLTDKSIVKHRDRILNVLGKTEITYKDSLIYRTDTVKIQLPASDVTVDTLIDIKNGIASLDTITAKKGLITMQAWVNNNMLGVNAWLNEKFVSKEVHDTIIVEVPTIKTVITPVDHFIEKELNWYQKFCIWSVSIILGLVILYLVLKFLPKVLGSTPTGGVIGFLFKLVK